MEIKLFEVRDHATCMPAMAIQVSGEDGPIMRRAGFGERAFVYMIFTAIEEVRYDPIKWGDRTRYTAHEYITEHWDELEDGQVIDVRFILGETDVPCEAECI